MSEPEVIIRELFLGFVPLQETTGAFIAETLLGQLEQMGLPIENLRGQGYDDGNNMTGKENGVQKRLLDINPRAFFCALQCTLFKLNLTSKLLQNKEADLNSAIRQLQVTKNYVVDCRCDEGFQQVLTDATEIAKELEILPNFETEQVRNRRKKRQFEYEAQEEAPQDPKQKFK
ncbi:zinc finger MYM-type protein 1-like, partial [Limulus polyphemus]|uniref:Zinc finger MYM-type protein 1-like n=1 Tax=Limulus polyphemus TaxID=6850 RepID=A0ABM1BPQ6_LIMPO